MEYIRICENQVDRPPNALFADLRGQRWLVVIDQTIMESPPIATVNSGGIAPTSELASISMAASRAYARQSFKGAKRILLQARDFPKQPDEAH